VSSLTLIVNPAAAGGRTTRHLPAVEARLTALGLAVEVAPTENLPHAEQLARDAAAGGRIVVGFGGDGLIGALAGALAGTDAILGVLPGGRGNDFARVLGIPRSPVAACDVLAHGSPRRIDLGRAGDRTFIGIASCGFDSDANRIANETARVKGSLVYAYGALRALAGWSPATFEIELDGGARRTFVGYSVAAANSRAYGGGMLLAPDASLQDGLLDIVTISDMPRLRLLSLLPTVFSGRHVRQSRVDVVRARSLRISADRPFALYADGDPVASLPVEITAIPNAVRILAPRER
jgi:YegS/Rv2252/BmrU family lipid kinase